MRYQNIREAVFLSRPNRFTAKCLLDGEEVVVHVKNTGRCKELLIPGTRVWLEKAASPERKTAWSLITVEKTLGNGEKLLINMDSQAPNTAAFEAAQAGDLPFSFLKAPLKTLRREVFFADSRYDLYGETGRFFFRMRRRNGESSIWTVCAVLQRKGTAAVCCLWCRWSGRSTLRRTPKPMPHSGKRFAEHRRQVLRSLPCAAK